MNSQTLQPDKTESLFTFIYGLSIFTVAYNLIEGLVSVYWGIADKTLTLFGFGADSFIELISGFGIIHMINRLRKFGDDKRGEFEKTALKITGYSFYGLVGTLIISSTYNLIKGNVPETTITGVFIAIISIVVMAILVYYKLKIGKTLNSDAIIADANCTKVCIYMSVTLLISSALYEFTHFKYLDIIGSLVIAYFSYQEGKECFEKAISDKNCGCKH